MGKPGKRPDSQPHQRAPGPGASSTRALLQRPLAWLLFGVAILALEWSADIDSGVNRIRLSAATCAIAAVIESLVSWDTLLRRFGRGWRATFRAAGNFAVYAGAVLLVVVSSSAVQLLAAAWLVYLVAWSSESTRDSLRWVDLATLWWALGIGYVIATRESVAMMVLPWLGLLCTAIKLRVDGAHQSARLSVPPALTEPRDTVPPEDDAYPSWVQHDSTLHDLGNAMTASLFMVRDLTRALQKGSEPNLRRALRLSQELAGELSQMSDHINTTRQSARWQAIAGSPVSIIEPVRRGAEHVSHLYPDVTCQIQCELPEEQTRVSVVGGVATLRRIVENLIINSCQALANCTEKQVLCTIELVGSTVTLTVSDNGPGFPRVILDLHPSPLVSTKSGGSGIGLYSCHQLVKRDGGKLRIANRETGGARVTVTWPQAPSSVGTNTSDGVIRNSGMRTRPGDASLELDVGAAEKL